MSKDVTMHSSLEPLVEALQNFILQDQERELPGDFVSRIEAAQEEARFLQLDDVLDALQEIRIVLERDTPDPQTLLPLVFAVQETMQTVAVEIDPVPADHDGARAEPSTTGGFLKWDADTDLEDVSTLDEQSRFLLDGALGAGLDAYLIRITLENDEIASESVLAVLEKELSIVRSSVPESGRRITLLAVSAIPPTLEGILTSFLEKDPGSLTYSFRKIDGKALIDSGPVSRAWYHDLAPVAISIEPAALDKMRFFISRLETLVQRDEQPLVRELSRTLESAVSVSLRELVNGLKKPLERLAEETRKPAAISFGGTVDHVPAELSDPLRTTLLELLTNAIVHGLEEPDRRRDAGKAPQGAIRVFGSVESDVLTLRVSDDGGGMDEHQAAPTGGLARVRSEVDRRFGGDVRITSGSRGTTVTVTIPATTGAWTALLCMRNAKPFLVPTVMVEAIIPVAEADLMVEPSGGRFMRYRDRLLPLVEPHWTDMMDAAPMAIVVTMHAGGFALSLDGAPEEVSVVPDGPGTARVPDRDMTEVPVSIHPPR